MIAPDPDESAPQDQFITEGGRVAGKNETPVLEARVPGTDVRVKQHPREDEPKIRGEDGQERPVGQVRDHITGEAGRAAGVALGHVDQQMGGGVSGQRDPNDLRQNDFNRGDAKNIGAGAGLGWVRPIPRALRTRHVVFWVASMLTGRAGPGKVLEMRHTALVETPLGRAMAQHKRRRRRGSGESWIA